MKGKNDNFEKQLERLMETAADDLEPVTHCCECTPGEHFQKHLVHIQYPNCKCQKKNFVLKKNS